MLSDEVLYYAMLPFFFFFFFFFFSLTALDADMTHYDHSGISGGYMHEA